MFQGRRAATQDAIFVLTILVPIILVVALLIYYPAIDAFSAGLTNRDLRLNNRPTEFVQFENYAYLLGNDEFWEVTGRSLVLVAIVLPMELTIALGAALLLNEKFYGRAVVRLWPFCRGWCRRWLTASSGGGCLTASTAR